MPKSEVKEWLSRADKDIKEAKFLFDNDRPLEHVALFLHQAVEKYLKGFLIHNGWNLEKTHDLVKLIQNAINFDQSLRIFIPLMQKMADYYIESRYPVGYLVKYTKNEIENSLKDSHKFAASITEKIL